MDMLYVTPWRHALRQEAEVVAVLLCQPDQRGAQRLGRLLDEGLEVDDVVTRRSATLGHDGVELLVLDEDEAERVQRVAYLLAVERAVLVPVSSLEHAPEHELTEAALARVHERRDHLRVPLYEV